MSIRRESGGYEREKEKERYGLLEMNIIFYAKNVRA
jgi:hypothetical protein